MNNQTYTFAQLAKEFIDGLGWSNTQETVRAIEKTLTDHISKEDLDYFVNAYQDEIRTMVRKFHGINSEYQRISIRELLDFFHDSIYRRGDSPNVTTQNIRHPFAGMLSLKHYIAFFKDPSKFKVRLIEAYENAGGVGLFVELNDLSRTLRDHDNDFDRKCRAVIDFEISKGSKVWTDYPPIGRLVKTSSNKDDMERTTYKKIFMPNSIEGYAIQWDGDGNTLYVSGRLFNEVIKHKFNKPNPSILEVAKYMKNTPFDQWFDMSEASSVHGKYLNELKQKACAFLDEYTVVLQNQLSVNQGYVDQIKRLAEGGVGVDEFSKVLHERRKSIIYDSAKLLGLRNEFMVMNRTYDRSGSHEFNLFIEAAVNVSAAILESLDKQSDQYASDLMILQVLKTIS